MNIKRTRVDFTCPACGDISQAPIGQLETGEYTCPHCEAQHHFDGAQATKMRDSIETNLMDMQDAFARIDNRK